MGQPISGESAWRRTRMVLPVANPAAGADWSTTVPGGHLFILQSITATLVSSAVVANRAAKLLLGDGVATFLTLPGAAVQAASLTNVYGWAVGGILGAVGTTQLGFLPPLTLAGGWTIGTSTGAIDVGDQWSAIRLHVLDVTARRGRVDLDALPDMLVGVVDLGPDQPVT